MEILKDIFKNTKSACDVAKKKKKEGTDGTSITKTTTTITKSKE